MFLRIPEYAMIHLYLQELEQELNKGEYLETEFKTIDKEIDNVIKFKCDSFIPSLKCKSLFIKELKYYGTLEFIFNKRNNEVYISKIPYILINNNKVPIFTSDLAQIITKLLSKYIPSNDIKITFADPYTVLAINQEVINIIPSITQTKNYQVLQTILERINYEIEHIEKNLEKQHKKLVQEDAKKEHALAKRRKICGLDSESYEQIEEFYEDVNKRLITMWKEKIENLTRHLQANIKKYKELIKASDEEALKDDIVKILKSDAGYGYNLNLENISEEEMESYLEKRLKLDLSDNGVLAKIKELKEDYLSERYTTHDYDYRYYLKENQYYEWFAEYISEYEHPAFPCTRLYSQKYDYANNKYIDAIEYRYDKKQFIRTINILEQIAFLQNLITYYQKLITNPNNAILNFTTNENKWNAIMQFPYWLKIGKDKKRNSTEKIYLLMIKPGVQTIELSNLRVFNNDKDKKRRFSIKDDFKCDRLIVTIPKSLSYQEICKLVTYSFNHAKQINFICEDADTSTITKGICIEQYLSIASSTDSYNWFDNHLYDIDSDLNEEFYEFTTDSKKIILVNTDPDYYRNYFLDTPDNKIYWHRFDYSSDYKFYRKNIINFNGEIDCAIKAFNEHGIEATLDMILELVLGSYSNNDRFPEIRTTYNSIIVKIENNVKKEFEELNRSKNRNQELEGPKLNRTKKFPKKEEENPYYDNFDDDLPF